MYTIRTASTGDQPFILDMLYEALYVPPGARPFPRSVLDEPAIARYGAGFGTQGGDVGLIADAEDGPIGAAWVRLLRGENRAHGHVDDTTPELTIALEQRWRGRGIGTALLRELIESVPRMSLSSDARNPAIGLYRRLGFEPVAHEGTSVTMLRRG